MPYVFNPFTGTFDYAQNIFSTIAVAGQSDVIADTTADTLTLVAGTNIGITTDATTDTVTISSTLIEGGIPEVGNVAIFTDQSTLTFNSSFSFDGFDLYIESSGRQSSIGYEGIYYAGNAGTYFALNTTGVYIGDGYPNPMDLIVSSYLTGFPDALTVLAALSRVGIRNSSPNQPLDVVGTVRIGYDTTNHLEISSSSTGLITYNATGTGSVHYFADAIRATNHINFDATIGDSGYGFRSSSGVMQFKNSGGSWQSIEKGSQALTANFTTSNTTATNTTLSFPIAANEKYKVRVTGTASKATSATGLKLAIAAPTGCTIKGVQYGGGATLAASLVPSLITAINTLGTAFATGIGIEVPFVLEFIVTNSSTAGNITLQAATVTSNTLTIYAGTSMQYEPYTGV